MSPVVSYRQLLRLLWALVAMATLASLALPTVDASNVYMVQNGRLQSRRHARINALRALSHSVIDDMKKSRRHSKKRSRPRGRSIFPSLPWSRSQQQQPSASKGIATYRRPQHHTRRQRPSFMSNFRTNSGLVRPHQEEPTFRSFMSRFRGLVLNGWNFMPEVTL